jgi:hypothetical protein
MAEAHWPQFMQTNQLLSLGALTLKAHILDQQAREIRNKLREYSRGGFWTSTSLDDRLTKLTISLKLPIYLQFAPEDLKPKCVLFSASEGAGQSQAYARLRYPEIEVGLIGPKKTTRLFIDAWSDPFTPPVIPVIEPEPLAEPVTPYNSNQLRIPTLSDTCSNSCRTAFQSCRTVIGAKRRAG